MHSENELEMSGDVSGYEQNGTAPSDQSNSF